MGYMGIMHKNGNYYIFSGFGVFGQANGTSSCLGLSRKQLTRHVNLCCNRTQRIHRGPNKIG